jgi:hypothetical protein
MIEYILLGNSINLLVSLLMAAYFLLHGVMERNQGTINASEQVMTRRYLEDFVLAFIALAFGVLAIGGVLLTEFLFDLLKIELPWK